jgi:multimeric flavodoxin WrbA/DNA-directed RNA polymerase subunit RPC12/RpoP
MVSWKCSVCGYVFDGKNPPSECPQCSSKSGEFILLKKKERLSFDGKKFDVLLINGSNHRAHNTGHMVDLAEEILKKRRVSYRRINLNELNIEYCWCCYSMSDASCTYPCRNQRDDVNALHQMVIASKAVIIASPINWNSMSGRLKCLLDRFTSLQNMALLKRGSLTKCKICGILVNGHEDGAAKTAMDIYYYLQEMGYLMAPYGFAYRTHNAQYNTAEDNDFYKKDRNLKEFVEATVNNVIATMKIGIESKLKNKIKEVCE